MADDQDFAELLKKRRKRFGWSQAALAERMGVHRNTIVKLETRERVPSRPEVFQLVKEFQLEGEERKEFLLAANLKGNASEEGLWNVPHSRNPFFTGHEKIFPFLWERLAPSRGTREVAITQALSGLGGIGKTQVAIEYAYRYANKYDAVFWLPADSVETLIAACLQLATNELGLPEQQDANKQVEAVKQWFRTHHKWLLILDNVENPQKIISVLVPSRHKGSVLITTRIREGGPLAHVVKLPLISPDDAVLFLLRRAGRIALDASIETAVPHDRPVASSLCTLLDRLPLALDQAGAYIAENGSSLEQYINLYHQYRQTLLDRRRAKDLKQITDHPDSVLMTFWLSWEQIQERNTLAGKTLQFCAFLAPDLIPKQLVQAGIMMSEAENTQEELEMEEALGLLYRYSLVERTEQTLSLHRLVQEVMQDVLSEEERQQWMERAVLVVNAVFPSGEHGTWLLCEFLLPHALACTKWIEALRQKKPEGAQLLSITGHYLYERAQYREAEPLYQRALSIREEQLGAFHPATASSLNNLALLCQSQGRYSEAEPLYQRALSIREEQLGAFHPATASSLNNLAALYQSQGRYGDAEPLLKRAILIAEEQLGASHPDVASSLNNLAELYRIQGRYSEAEPLLKRALTIYEQQLGASHPVTASSLNNLALLCQSQGRYSEAEPLLKRALSIREEQLGVSHPATATSLNNLAAFYQSQGRYGDAEPPLKRALSIREEQLGASHPDTATSLNNLADLYQSQGWYGDAEPLLKRALLIAEEQLGASHPDTASSLNNLAALYLAQGRYGDAEPLLKRALSIREEQLGVSHPDTASSLNNLGALYLAQGRYGDAEPLSQQAVQVTLASLGMKHPQTQMMMMNYLTLLSHIHTNGDVEALLQLLTRGGQNDDMDGE